MPKVHIAKDDKYYDYNLANGSYPTDSLLVAGLHQGFNLPYHCNKGTCGACKCKVLSGSSELIGAYDAKALSPQEIERGYTLLCRAYTTDDLVIELPSSLDSPRVRIFKAQVIEVINRGEVGIIKLKVIKPAVFDFLPGQYIDVRFDGKSRSYSIANIADNNIVELHVKNYHAKGSFFEFIKNSLNIDEHNRNNQDMVILKFKGPLGWFGVSSWAKPMILVCTGTGFAPVKAIIEQWIKQKALNPELTQPIYLYWGNVTIEDFYLLDLVKKWSNLFMVKLCLASGSDPGFYLGDVTQALKADFVDLSIYDLYACGNISIIEEVHALAVELRLDASSFFCDGFTPAPKV